MPRGVQFQFYLNDPSSYLTKYWIKFLNYIFLEISLFHSYFRFLRSIKDREIFYICLFGQNLTQVNTWSLSFFILRPGDILYFYTQTWGHNILLYLDLGTCHTFILRPGDISYFYTYFWGHIIFLYLDLGTY